jgi:hypothetical protein
LADLQALEVKRSRPLSHDDTEFRKHDTKWIYKPGLHIGISSGEEGHHIVFMVRIRYAKYFIILSTVYDIYLIVHEKRCHHKHKTIYKPTFKH